MNKLQELVYNNGERLVPYITHNEGELVRHRSSYAFFHSVIDTDLRGHQLEKTPVSVADLGFGSGYGCALLSSLPESCITGVDIGEECMLYARQYYPRSNVNYIIEDLKEFIPKAEPFDYVVSRGVLEHVPNGLELVKEIKFTRRVMIDVPYDEEPGNEHHILTGIKEDTFADHANCEFFYEDLEGQIFDAANKPEKSNMIMVVLSSTDLPKVSSLFKFPLQPVRDTRLEALSNINATGRRYYSDSPVDLLTTIEKSIKETEVVLDIGCGIAPMNYFRPKLHILVEPWKEYADILSYRYARDKSVIINRNGALESLLPLAENSVDSIFLLDVIEHLEKDVGRQVITESERVAREQIVIFTPLGFMPQHVENSECDGWGLGGNTVQEHLSGWEPEDFDEAWSFYICKNFHSIDFKGEPLDETYGAFFAVRNFEAKSIAVPGSLTDFRLPLPSELEVERLNGLNNELQQQIAAHEAAYNSLYYSRGLRVIRMLKKCLGSLGISRYK